jgi:hypothetical protein
VAFWEAAGELGVQPDWICGKWCGITDPTMLGGIYHCFASSAVVCFSPDLDEADLIPSGGPVQLVILFWFKSSGG